jgi:hypothetical protein
VVLPTIAIKYGFLCMQLFVTLRVLVVIVTSGMWLRFDRSMKGSTAYRTFCDEETLTVTVILIPTLTLTDVASILPNMKGSIGYRTNPNPNNVMSSGIVDH